MQPYSSGMKYSLGYDRSLVSTYNHCSQASVRKWINRGRLHDTCRAEMHGVLNYCWPRFQCTVAEPLLWYKLKMVSRSQCVWLWNLHVCRKCYTCTRVCVCVWEKIASVRISEWIALEVSDNLLAIPPEISRVEEGSACWISAQCNKLWLAKEPSCCLWLYHECFISLIDWGGSHLLAG